MRLNLLFNEGDLQERTIILTRNHSGEPGKGVLVMDMDDPKDMILNRIQGADGSPTPQAR